jgi:hypothetical protein
VHFFPYYPHYVQHSGVDWTAVAAIGTFAVVFVTAWLAVSTRKLARASTADQRAQWRPILTVDPEGQVDYDDATGEWSLELRNVGRGPAFGVYAELRSGPHPIGASIPGLGATALAPGQSFRLRARVTDPSKYRRGHVVNIEVTYYDVTEYWHKSHLTMIGRRPPDRLDDESVPLELEIAKVLFEPTNKRLGAVHGSPRAIEEARLANEPPAKRLLRWIRSHGDS